MTNDPIIKKPRLHFEATSRPPHITFEDAAAVRRNMPWHSYVETFWDPANASTLKVTIGDWHIELRGHNLAPLYLAIEEQTLLRVRAQPELKQDPARVIDTFVTEIIFTRIAPPLANWNPGQTEMNLTD